MEEYDLEYALVAKESFENVYMKEDEKYTEIYNDQYFVIYQYESQDN